MPRQIRILAKLQLCNLYGLNVFRFSGDKKAKRKTVLLMIIWAILILMIAAYVGGFSYGLILLGLDEVLPAYLITICSLIILFFGIFKAGNVIFQKNGYDILCSLPVSQTAIVVSRFIRMYVENLMLALAVMMPGTAVYAYFIRPDVLFYLTSVLGILFIPLIPVTLATIFGAVVTGITSRMKHKSLAGAILSILLVPVVLLGTSRLSSLEESVTPEMILDLSGLFLPLLKKLYPPAVWMGTAIVSGNILNCLACIGAGLLLFGIMAALVSANFHSICRGLYSTSARHDYRMERLRKDSVLLALYKREFRRYFASGIYVTNTIMGPVMAVVFSAGILFTGVDTLLQSVSIFVDINGVIPFILAAVFSLMTATSVSISMEGKEWWIVKSLPLETKTILDSKILMNLSLIFPFYLASEVLLGLALRPEMIDMFWLIVIPAVLLLFTCVWGITVNLHFPVFNWENEVTVVKQSASAMIGGIGGTVASILCAVPVLLVSDRFLNLLRLGLCVLLLGVTAFLYRKNSAVNLQEI